MLDPHPVTATMPARKHALGLSGGELKPEIAAVSARCAFGRLDRMAVPVMEPMRTAGHAPLQVRTIQAVQPGYRGAASPDPGP